MCETDDRAAADSDGIPDYQLDIARKALATMVKTTAEDDKPGQRMIRKYRQLIREEEARRVRVIREAEAICEAAEEAYVNELMSKIRKNSSSTEGN